MRRHLERIDIGQQMPACPVGVYELKYIGLFLDLFRCAVDTKERRVEVLGPTHRRGVYFEGVKDLVVELMIASQEFGDLPQEQTALGTLYHAVVICTCDRHRLADTELRER